MTRRRVFVGACLALLGACGRTPDKSSAPIADNAGSAHASPPSTAVRLLRAGGRAGAYALPSLEPLAWRTDGPVAAIESLIGADYERHLLLALDRKHSLVALDLEERKARVLAPQIRAAAVGPDGTIYAVDSGRSVLQISRRTTTRFPGTLNQQPSSIAAAAGGSALAIETGRVAVIGPDGTRRVATPRGPVATTYWGDLLAVGTDSGVVFFDPQSRRQPARVPASARTRALLFSPSGHRLYAAGGDHELLVIDRFGHTVLRRIQLPGTASALRVDFFGNWLLARATGADSVWVIDLDAERVIGSVATTWAADLPAVAAPRTLILREHRDVVARDLASAALTETGRVKDGASDVWVAVSWAPAPAAAEPTADTARVATTAPTPPPAADTGATTTADTAADRAEPPAGPTDARLYLQVSSSRNPSWADDLAGKLRAAGLQPTVLKPAGSEETYRVVLGPFPTREAAEETGRRLGMPSFVITAQGDSGR